MIYFKDELNNIHAIEEEHQQLLLDKGYTIITDVEVDGLLAPTIEDMKNIQFQNLKKDLNVRLNNKVYTFEDGSKIRIRPADDMNIRNAIEIMEHDNITNVEWLSVDNHKKQVTVADLKAALVTRQRAFLALWKTYVNSVDSVMKIKYD